MAVKFALPMAMLVSLAGFAIAVSAVADEGESSAVAHEDAALVAAAVEQLASPDRATRAAAERQLVDAGPRVLWLLPDAADVAHPAARAALERVRHRLEQEAVRRAAGATTIEVEWEGPAGRLELHQPLALTPEQGERLVSLSHDGSLFWKVIDDLAEQLDAQPGAFDPTRGLIFRARTPDDAFRRIAYAGAFRLAAGPASLRPIAGEDQAQLVRLPIELRAEPGLRPLFLAYSAARLTLTASDGTTLPPFVPEARHELPFGERGGAVELRLDFVARGEPQTPLALRGIINVTLAAGQERFETELRRGESAAPRTERQANVMVRFREQSWRPDDKAEVELAIVYERGGPAFESHRTWLYHNAAALEISLIQDGQEQIIRLDAEPGFTTIAQAESGAIVRYRFTGIPKGAQRVRFVYDAPTSIIEMPLEFEIKDLPIRYGAPQDQ